jgi:hypothetical protein
MMRTWLIRSMALLLSSSSSNYYFTSADVVLNEKIMQLSKTAAELSILAYAKDPPNDIAFKGGNYEAFGFFDEEPDQALMVKTKDGYCFGAFRGTVMTWLDWKQNLHMGKKDVCANKICCSTRAGFYNAYITNYTRYFEESLRACAKTCTRGPDDCVVLTGHSQGGAIAAVAALFLADLNPYVITFGQPNTIDAPCELTSSERWYRYVNTKASKKVGLVYDPVPFVPGLGAASFGHMILLSNGGVSYVGLDAQDSFSPLNFGGFESHSMQNTTEYPGYLVRIEAIVDKHTHNNASSSTYPVRTSGYVANSLCTEDIECESQTCDSERHFNFPRCIGVQCEKDKDCESDRCDSGTCLAKLTSCQSCDENSDCAGGTCRLWKCSGSNNGLMDDNCVCTVGSDCDSGRCEGFALPICEAKVPIGAYCDESTDCLSEYCSWGFKCEPQLEEGSFCRKNIQCKSGHCSWWFKCSATTTAPKLMTKEAFPVVIVGNRPKSASTSNKVTEGASKYKSKGVSEVDGVEENKSKGPTMQAILGAITVLIIGFFVGKYARNSRKDYQEVPSVTMTV